jgi:hypothetical protein
METLEFIKKPVDGKLVIDMPEGWEGKEVEVKITDIEPLPALKKFAEMPPEERIQELMKYWATAKYPDFPISKNDIYGQ